MNVDHKLGQIKSQFPQHSVDKKKFSESFWTRVEELDKTHETNRRHLKWMIPGAAVLVITGATFSPMIATAVQTIPFVQVVTDWVKGTPAAPYVSSIQQSATDHGITMTITDVLYGPSELSFGYIVTPGQSGYPHGGAVPLGSPDGMQFFIDGKQVHLQGIGGDEATPYGFKGMVTLTDDGTDVILPDSFNLQLEVHKIGNQQGTWTFSVPVSRHHMKPEQTFLPMTTKQVDDETITVKEVQLYPPGGTIEYNITAPVGEKTLMNLSLFDQDKQILDLVTSDPSQAISHVTTGALDTWSFSHTFRIRNQNPTSLIVAPFIPSSETHQKSIPITGPFPVTVDDEMFGQLVITGSTVNRKQVVVRYHYAGTDGMRGSRFRVTDLTHPNQNFSASLGEHDGPSGLNDYKTVYEYFNDVSSDQLVIQLPSPLQNTFEVPLKN